jgi:hypothetical protein
MAGEHLPFDREAVFPKLRRGDYRVTSDEDESYNCIAHAAGKDDNWWWPVDADVEGVHWPDGVELKEAIEAFIRAYETEGYIVCEGRDLEVGVEKIAIYVDVDGIPTHAARQLADGSWTSKLGGWEDIQHQTLEALEADDDEGRQGLGYGKVAVIMRRPRRQFGGGGSAGHRYESP